MANEKLFGKYNEFILILLGFVLTGIVGTYIAQKYTTKNAELSAANKIFSEYSKLAGDRYFTMNQIALALQNKSSKEVLSVRWDAYRVEIQKWNTARGYNREMIKLYFGKPIWNEERDIHYLFRAWGQALELEKKAAKSINFNCLNQKRDELLNKLYAFNYSLGAAIQNGNIGSCKSKHNAELNSVPETLCLTSRSRSTAQ